MIAVNMRAETGRGALLTMSQFGALPHKLVLRSIERFGKEVLPAVRDV